MASSSTKAVIIFFFKIVIITELKAQGVVVTSAPQDIHYAGKTYNGIKGNPFLFEDWVKGTVKLTDETVFEGLKLKYDQLKDEIYFAIDDNTTKAFLHPVKEFIIEDATAQQEVNKRVFRNGYAPIDRLTEKSFYEVLHDGPVSLLKRTSKSIVEERAEGQTYKTKQIQTSEKYYLATAGGLVKIAKDKKSLLAALPDRDKVSKLETHIVNEKLNLKNDKALMQTIAYYNSL